MRTEFGNSKHSLPRFPWFLCSAVHVIVRTTRSEEMKRIIFDPFLAFLSSS